MAIYNTPDGRQVVGSVESGNDYHGFNGKRDIIIQLAADGATTDGLNALEYLKAYAVEQNKQNKPIFPNGTRVFISANGYTKAVEADDIVIDGDNITIGGIKWDGSAWDYSEAGQTGSALPPITDADDGKVLTANSGVWGAQNPKFVVTLTLTSESGGVADKTNAEIAEAFESGKSVWFTGNMGGMVGSFPLKVVTYLTGYEYPFIGTEFDMITMSTTEIYSTSKYMIAMSGSDTPNNVFAMKAYPLDTPSANGVSF